MVLFYFLCVGLPAFGLYKSKYKKCFTVLLILGVLFSLYRPFSLSDKNMNTIVINSYDVPVENVDEKSIIKNVPNKYDPNSN